MNIAARTQGAPLPAGPQISALHPGVLGRLLMGGGLSTLSGQHAHITHTQAVFLLHIPQTRL
jgi:hypothetical protein